MAAPAHTWDPGGIEIDVLGGFGERSELDGLSRGLGVSPSNPLLKLGFGPQPGVFRAYSWLCLGITSSWAWDHM